MRNLMMLIQYVARSQGPCSHANSSCTNIVLILVLITVVTNLCFLCFKQCYVQYASTSRLCVSCIHSPSALKCMLPDGNAQPLFENTALNVTICQTVRPHIPEGSDIYPQSIFAPWSKRSESTASKTAANTP